MADQEADIVVNGNRLTHAQSMTLRVALSAFVMDDDALKELGPIGQGYADRGNEVLSFMLRGIKP